MFEDKDFLIKKNDMKEPTPPQKNVKGVVMHDCGQVVKKLSIENYMKIKKTEMEFKAKNFTVN